MTTTGVLRTGVSNTAIGWPAINSYPVIIGPFSSNGKPKTVIVSWNLNGNMTTNSNPGTLSPPLMSWTLERMINQGAWTAVSSGNFTGSVTQDYELGTYYVGEGASASQTFTDNTATTGNYSYRLKVTNYDRNLSNSNTDNQSISVTSTEQ